MLRFAVAAASILASAGVAGAPEPVHIRSVTIDGIKGAGYYSVIEQGYRLVGPGAPVKNSSPDPNRIALPPVLDQTQTRTAAVADDAIMSADDLSRVVTGSSGESGL